MVWRAATIWRTASRNLAVAYDLEQSRTSGGQAELDRASGQENQREPRFRRQEE
jgi:hypothetical protein